MNLLFVTLDQCRADAVGGERLVQTPTLDSLCEGGVRFDRHYSQAAPCAPGRAALYTGTYQMNNRVVANGTPLARLTMKGANICWRGTSAVPSKFAKSI